VCSYNICKHKLASITRVMIQNTDRRMVWSGAGGLPVERRPQPTDCEHGFVKVEKLQAAPKWTTAVSLLICSQVMIVVVLGSMVFSLLFISYSASSTANYYYPYVAELSNHTMMILRHGDASSASLETVMSQSEELAVTSIPELIDSVNRTSAMVANMQELSRSPVIKLSMG
jgi:hypothetical protein